MKPILTLLLLFNFCVTLVGQDSSAFRPKNLGEAVNSPYDDINPVISPDGNTLFFTRTNHPENTYGHADSQDIWYAKKENGSWAKARRLESLNVARYNNVLGMTPDGNHLLLNGIFTLNGAHWKKCGLSISTKDGMFWSTPEKVRLRKYTKHNRGRDATLSPDGKTIFMSLTHAYNDKRTNLYVSRQKVNGKWSRPKKLRGVNSFRTEHAPFISPDNKTLFFSSDQDEKGAFNIYSARIIDDSDLRFWQPAFAMGDTLNSSGWDAYYKTNRRASQAYFSSDRNGGLGRADIYTVKIFEENPFVLVSGKTINKSTGKLLTRKDVSLKINGVHQDSIKINRVTATYSVWLPLRKKYTLSAGVRNTTASDAIVDATTLREFKKVTRDLYVTPFPYVRVTVNAFEKDTRKQIPAFASPHILVDDHQPDSVDFDQAMGTYSFLLPHGAKYSLMLSAIKYEPVPTVLDLTDIEEYIDTLVNVYAARERMAMVRGTIVNKKTNAPFKAGRRLAINVIDESTILAAVDTVNSTFELLLPFGKTYEISASAPDHYPVYELIDARDRTNEIIRKDLILAPIEVGQAIRLNNIFFQTGKSTLKPESFAELDRVVKFLSENKIEIEIAGHTDNVGKAASNQRLSQNRAAAVVKYIVSKGISAKRLIAKGYGSTKPVTDNKTAEAKAQNRRVEFVILKE